MPMRINNVLVAFMPSGGPKPPSPRTMRNSSPPVESLETRLLMHGDVVLEWNQILFDAIAADQTQLGPTWASRNAAIVHAAIFDAVNAIDQSYTPYLVNTTAPAWVSKKAAAAAAANRVLSALYPQQQAKFDAALTADLAEIPDGPSETRGVQLGRYVADQILAARRYDGAYRYVPYTYGTGPGDYRPTPPDFTTPPLGTQWPYVKPFVMQTGSQFRPGPPPALTSPEYTAAFKEVKFFGAADSPVRTPDQTQIANFWSYDLQQYGTPIAIYNQVTRTIARQKQNTLVENARLFALVNLAEGDSGISAWDAKYVYNFWRPVTGIRKANTDGNPNTTADPTWLPLGIPGSNPPHQTPNFPSYVSGHSTFGTAAFDMISNFYNTYCISFNATSASAGGAVRHYDDLLEAIDENGDSRIYLGVHWRFDDTPARKMGHAIADYVFSHVLLPRSPSCSDHPLITQEIAINTPSTLAESAPMSTAFSTLPLANNPINDLLTGSPPDSVFEPVSQ